MKIGISTRGLNQGSYAISTIILNLTRTIIDLTAEKHEVYLYFNDPKLEALFNSSVKKRSVHIQNKFIWDQTWLPMALRKDQIDIVLLMKGTIPLHLPCKAAVIFHDLGYFDAHLRPYKFFDTIYMRWMMSWASRKSEFVFADSEYTREETIRILGTDNRKVTVCYQNCDPIYQGIKDVDTLNTTRALYNLPSHYIFSPINLSPRKNVNRILNAFDQVRHRIPHHLVITGGQSWGVRSLQERRTAEFDDRIHILGTIQQSHMPAIYSMASFMLYPSLIEGFGIPILESFRCGCPVITSNIASMPEVAGDAAYAVDPYNQDQISEGILKLATQEKLRQDLVIKGFERAKLFSWERTAGIILSKILEPAGSRPHFTLRGKNVASGLVTKWLIRKFKKSQPVSDLIDKPAP